MIVVLYVLIITAIAVALVFSRKRNVVDIRETTYAPPTHIDRSDFDDKSEILMVVFSSSKCDSCIGILAKASAACSKFVGMVNVEYEDPRGKKLHEKYQIDAVPTLVIVDLAGNVSRAFVGSVSAADLWAALARERGDDIAECGH